ncbi:hypothetical protein [Blautia producta]
MGVKSSAICDAQPAKRDFRTNFSLLKVPFLLLF